MMEEALQTTKQDIDMQDYFEDIEMEAQKGEALIIAMQDSASDGDNITSSLISINLDLFQTIKRKAKDGSHDYREMIHGAKEKAKAMPGRCALCEEVGTMLEHIYTMEERLFQRMKDMEA